MSMVRSRWAAVGAAVAVSLGAGGIGLVSATTSSGERTVLTILDQPCRIAALRPAPNTVGPRPAPLAANETYTITAHGTTGDCTLPTDAVALSLNVTALNATQSTNLRLWATGATQPTTSNLNPTPGQPPAPNAVTTGLSDDGKFNVYNFQGNVHVIIDVLGYYTDHNHDDRYYTKAQSDAMHPLAASTGVGTRCNADGTADGGPRAGQYDPCSGDITLGSSTAHSVLLVADIGWGIFQGSGGVKGACHIERAGVEIPDSEITMGETVKTTEESNAGGINNRRLNWAGVTAVSGPHTGSATYRVACREVVGDMQFNEVSLSGIVTSQP